MNLPILKKRGKQAMDSNITLSNKKGDSTDKGQNKEIADLKDALKKAQEEFIKFQSNLFAKYIYFPFEVNLRRYNRLLSEEQGELMKYPHRRKLFKKDIEKIYKGANSLNKYLEYLDTSP